MRLLPTAKEPEVLSRNHVDELVKRFAAICMERNVILMYLHGSYARGEPGPLSDLDLAVLLGRDKSGDLDLELELLAALEDASGREDLDLVFLDRAGPIIKERVVRHGRVIYQRSNRERVLFEASAIKEYLDFRYFSEQYNDALFETLSKGRVVG
ncbi:MAG TPA: nucleotidyltransferase domain-containing protein [Vicinamibacteria bacterium]|nr:nucleotidyltransferase domain-containing protein [Vicinamibacteria bacterium]